DFHMAVPAELVDAGPATGSGTRVRFWADPDIFESTDYDFDVVARRLQEMAFLNKGLTITLTDRRSQARDAAALDATADSDAAEAFGEGSDTDTDTATPADPGADAEAGAGSAGVRERKRTFHYPDGLKDYVTAINKSKTPIHRTILYFEGKGTGHEVEVAMQWNSGYSESVHTFANTINTHEGGTHEEGFRAALTSLVNKYARDKKLVKDKDPNLTGDDIREGL